jgi:hypothetical protein
MPDPNVLTAMPEAAARVADAVVRGERVAIFGDYVDGATSAALLARFLRHAGIDPIIHIPDRLFEGYGPNNEAVRALAVDDVRDGLADPGDFAQAPLADDLSERHSQRAEALGRARIGFGAIGITAAQGDPLPEFAQQLDDLGGVNHRQTNA